MFDPAAGEVPEHLEVYPPGKPFPWRNVVRSMVLTGIGLTAWNAYDDYKNRDAGPGSLVVVESAPLQVVCDEATHFSALHEYAPCDATAMTTLTNNDVHAYYVAFAVHLSSDGHMSGKKPYLLGTDCYLANFGTLAPVDSCVVARLQD